MLVFYKKKECLFQYSNLSLVTFSLWPSPGRNVRCIMANIREDKHGVSQLKPEDGGEREGRGLGPARTAVPGKGRLVPAFSPWMNLEESPTGLPSQHFLVRLGRWEALAPPPFPLGSHTGYWFRRLSQAWERKHPLGLKRRPGSSPKPRLAPPLDADPGARAAPASHLRRPGVRADAQTPHQPVWDAGEAGCQPHPRQSPSRSQHSREEE